MVSLHLFGLANAGPALVEGVDASRIGAAALSLGLTSGAMVWLRVRGQRRRDPQAMTTDLVSDRALGRATLARQLLLERSALAAVDAIEHLVGLQAQNPMDPYLALWSRLEPFDPVGVGESMEQRRLVRIVVMRGTIHLLTGDDALALRPLMQPALDAELARHGEFAPFLVDVDLDPVLAYARQILSDDALSGSRLRVALASRFPDLHAPALATACRCLLPLVQVPPRGVWGRTKQVTSTLLDSWLGRPMRLDSTLDEVVVRYLAAFGPASTADVATWCRLSGLGEVVERLRSRLRTFRNEAGRTLYDLPEAPRPDPDTPAPVRFLPEYDNLLLSHADRARFVADRRSFANASGPFKGSVLVDGAVGAVWHPTVDRRARRATMVVEHLRLGARARSELEAEAHRTAGFWLPPGHGRDVRLLAVA